MQQEWFKNAVIYGVNVPTFADSDGDGWGDFRGLTSRLDYLADLGVDCLWVLPFYPSPRQDNGYDVTNYYGIDPRFGTLDDFRDFVQEASARHIRIIIDLVVHHTSDKHPWFEAAKNDRRSLYRDYYIWSDTIPHTPTEESFFPEVESGVWRYDPTSKSYFRHGFYHFQPDLNFANYRVQDEVFAIVDFWLSFGIAGFRIDAANHIIGRKGLPHTEVLLPQSFWQKIRTFIVNRQPDAVLLAEADMDISHIDQYVIGGTGLHMLLNFWSNQTMVYALASGDVKPLMDTLGELPMMPQGSQYVNFLRNIDELNLARLNLDEQKMVYNKFGRSKNMQVYNRGIRRRLAPMLGGDTARLKLAYSMLFSMPGAAMLPYGDEIGMGDNLALPERESVRTPMQWSDEDNGGFSTAPTGSLIAPMVTDAKYTYKKLNVEMQASDPDSLLNFMKQLIALKKHCDMIGGSSFEPIHTGDPGILGHRYKNAKTHLVVLHNLTDKPLDIKLKPKIVLDGLTEIFADSDYSDNPASGTVRLYAYGFRWFGSE